MSVTILNSSQNTATGDTLTTFLLEGFPKCLLAELNTHRALSRNTESSRARPIKAVVKQVLQDPFDPIITVSQSGMSGNIMRGFRAVVARKIVRGLRYPAIIGVLILDKICVHKQNANRYLEPWMKVSVIVSATEWDNFLALRCGTGTQLEFREFALSMRDQLESICPVSLSPGECHKPWPLLSEAKNVTKVARVSYANHGRDLLEKTAQEKVDFLWANEHLSPFEMVAIAATPGEEVIGNYKGFHQLRHTYEERFHEQARSAT